MVCNVLMLSLGNYYYGNAVKMLLCYPNSVKICWIFQILNISMYLKNVQVFIVPTHMKLLSSLYQKFKTG
uniref:Uncharacterized protein n=1 Tax=Arundo donax TaxID=35708 RepID=A0A0A9C401_ARUDO